MTFPASPLSVINKMMIIGCGLLLVGCKTSLPSLGSSAQLSSCSIENSPFLSDQFDEWKDEYHYTVQGVIDADITALSTPQCSETTEILVSPTAELTALATKLTPWKSSTALAQLSEADMGAVLLEYLRTYECAMLEYREFFPNYAVGEEGMSLGEYNALHTSRTGVINEELQIARAALDRTLAVTGRMNRLRSFFSDINCITAASLDLRNELGLMAEISACLPRVRDTRTSLRDQTP